MKKTNKYNRKIFDTGNPRAVLVFCCPFGTKIALFRSLIKKLNKDGFTVLAYDFNNKVFFGGEGSYLIDLVNEVLKDMSMEIQKYKDDGFSDIGFFGTSLGAFILYEAISVIPGFKWGVLNTGGDVAKGIWKIKRSRRAFIKNGYSLEKLQSEWHDIQYLYFKTDLSNCHIVFIGSDNDPITPLNKIKDFATYIHDQSGASIETIKVKGMGHNHTAFIGLRKARSIIKKLDGSR